MDTELHKRLEEAAEKTNSVHINTRPSTDKEIAFKEEIKRKYHLSETTAELIAGRIELALMRQREEILAQAKKWLEEHSHIGARMVGKIHCTSIMTENEMLADFEADMNKLWEEQK